MFPTKLLLLIPNFYLYKFYYIVLLDLHTYIVLMLGPLLLVYIGFDFFQQNNGPSFRTLNDAIDL